jgi:hypothetical protein
MALTNNSKLNDEIQDLLETLTAEGGTITHRLKDAVHSQHYRRKALRRLTTLGAIKVKLGNLSGNGSEIWRLPSTITLLKTISGLEVSPERERPSVIKKRRKCLNPRAPKKKRLYETANGSISKEPYEPPRIVENPLVDAMNAEQQKHDWQGCRTPSLHQTFIQELDGSISGGRLSARHMNIAKETGFRERILIDAFWAALVDVKSCFPSILYCQHDSTSIPLSEVDFYGADGFPTKDRKLFKAAWCILLSSPKATGWKQLSGKMYGELEEEYEWDFWFRRSFEKYKAAIQARFPWARYVGAARLQRQESLWLEKVIERLFLDNKIGGTTFHDCVMVGRNNRFLAASIMKACFKECFGQECQVKFSGASLADLDMAGASFLAPATQAGLPLISLEECLVQKEDIQVGNHFTHNTSIRKEGGKASILCEMSNLNVLSHGGRRYSKDKQKAQAVDLLQRGVRTIAVANDTGLSTKTIQRLKKEMIMKDKTKPACVEGAVTSTAPDKSKPLEKVESSGARIFELLGLPDGEYHPRKMLLKEELKGKDEKPVESASGELSAEG